jgi:tetraacyldisaccharide-1-P 4'-kinase
VWRAERRLGPVDGLDRTTSVVAVAGIASPGNFFGALRAAGWNLARELPFPDHHRFAASDLDRVCSVAREVGAAAVLTTEKDFVRLLPFRPFRLPVVVAPLVLELAPLDLFDGWLRNRLAAARA